MRLPVGQVLRAGALECDDCDSTGSKESYCDCGHNSVFSMDARLDGYLSLSSPEALCTDKVDCDSGSYPARRQCVTCMTGDCGVCGPCNVERRASAASALPPRAAECVPSRPPRMRTGRRSIPSTASTRLAPFASSTSCESAPTGTVCTCDPDVNGCIYQGTSVPLSQ